MRHACVTAALVFARVDMHATYVDNYERTHDNNDNDQDR